MSVSYQLEHIDDASVRLLNRVDFRLAAVVLVASLAYYKAHSGNRRIKVTSGLRRIEEQQELVRAGKSRTMNSAHLDGLAVDLAILLDNGQRAIWGLGEFRRLDTYMQAAAPMIGLADGDLLWGGHWTTLRDGPHWQLMLPRVQS